MKFIREYKEILIYCIILLALFVWSVSPVHAQWTPKPVTVTLPKPSPAPAPTAPVPVTMPTRYPYGSDGSAVWAIGSK
jgi:hypothetical protein